MAVFNRFWTALDETYPASPAASAIWAAEGDVPFKATQKGYTDCHRWPFGKIDGLPRYTHLNPVEPIDCSRNSCQPGVQQGSLHTPEHCLVNGGFPLVWWKKQHVSNGCKMYLLRSAVQPQASTFQSMGCTYTKSNWLSGWPKKSPNFIFTPKMVQTQKV